MLWYFLQLPYAYSDGPLQGDIAYLVGLVLMLCGLWRDAKKKANGWLCLVLGGMMVMAAFLIRFHMVTWISRHPDDTAKTIALTRTVLHTLFAPLLIVMVGSVVKVIQEQIARCRTWWQTGLWLTGIAFTAWLCLGVVHSLYKSWGRYDVPHSHYDGEHEGYP